MHLKLLGGLQVAIAGSRLCSLVVTSGHGAILVFFYRRPCFSLRCKVCIMKSLLHFPRPAIRSELQFPPWVADFVSLPASHQYWPVRAGRSSKSPADFCFVVSEPIPESTEIKQHIEDTVHASSHRLSRHVRG